MVEVILVLLGISFILFFGFFAEFAFKKIHIPDILFLIILGFALGPYGLNYIQPERVAEFAPVFTTFALLFLLYDGAFNIDLASFARGVTKSLGITFFNFFVSVIVVSGIMYLFTYNVFTSLLTGTILGGISSAFVIPLIKQLHVKGETYSILTLESAITDVLCIVSALTVMEIMKLNVFNFQIMVSKIAALFAVAGFIGIIAGIFWIIIVIHIFREHKSYMITIAYLILVYVVAEFLNGNGAIAALFLGLVLRNSKQLTAIFAGVVNKHEAHKENKAQYKAYKGQGEKKIAGSHLQGHAIKPTNENYGIAVTSPMEEFFYSQISFFLKTFFFVYIGILFNIDDTWALLIGAILSLAIMFSRSFSGIVTKAFNEFDRKLMKSIFARGLAAAAIAQIVLFNNIENALLITNTTYSVITFTIILSSIKIFFIKKNHHAAQAIEVSK